MQCGLSGESILRLALAGHGSSPAVAETLIKELSHSRRRELEWVVKTVPPMLRKVGGWDGGDCEIRERE